MLTIYAFEGGPISDYIVVASDANDDVFLQRRANGELYIANNSSFFNIFTSAGIPPITHDTLYVTNGTASGVAGAMYPGDNSVRVGDDARERSTVYFSLANGNIRRPSFVRDVFGNIERDSLGAPVRTDPFRVTIAYAGSKWVAELLDPDDPQRFVVTQTFGTSSARPTNVTLNSGSTVAAGQGLRGYLTIDWVDSSGNLVDVATVPHDISSVDQPPVLERVEYTFNVGDAAIGASERTVYPSARQIDPDTNATPDPAYEFDVGPLGVIDGTLTGSIDFLDDYESGFTGMRGFESVSFATDLAGGGTLFFGDKDFVDIDWMRVRGKFGGSSITLSFTNRYPATRGIISIPADSRSVFPARVQVSGVKFLQYERPTAPSNFTLFAGHDLPSQLWVDLLAPGSTINIDSPVIVGPLSRAKSERRDVELRATNVNVSAQVKSTDSFYVNGSDKGTALAERLTINASVAVPEEAVFYLYNDPYNDIPGQNEPGGPNRGQLFISPSGSISGSLAASSADVTTATSLVLINATTTDVIMEGTVFGKEQSYLLQSKAADSDRAPYYLTTTSLLTGANTGLLRGDTVAITLANDAPTPIDDSITKNVVDLDTQIASFRIKASTSLPSPASGPFPYELTVREKDSISFDAVAASGMPISLSAGGSIAFTSALSTANGITIAATSASGGPPTKFNISAPLSTVRGQIKIAADDLAILNSLTVLSPEIDPTLNDIELSANAGSIQLVGRIAAVNNIDLLQRNAGSTIGKVYGPARVKADRLRFDVAGAVGDSSVPFTNSHYFLRTDANTISGQAGAGFAIDELNDVYVDALRVPAGLVSLRANGVDPGNGSINEIALAGNLIDVVGLFASAPNGSVDLRNETAKVLLLGAPTAIQRQTTDPMMAAGNVTIRSTAGSVNVLDAPVAGGSARRVRVATTAHLDGTYTADPGSALTPAAPGTRASTITSTSNVSLNSLTTFDGLVNLRVGDRILVRAGTGSSSSSPNMAANGVYEVSQLGGASAPWILTRAADSDTPSELLNNTLVRVTEGATLQNKVFQLSISGSSFFSNAMTVSQFTPVTNIGSDNISSTTNFIVSSSAGTNSSAGSLGKMLLLRQQNDTSTSLLNPSQKMGFAFSSLVSEPIQLTEELPDISGPVGGGPLAIDGAQRMNLTGGASPSSSRIVIDGTRINRTKIGNAAFSGSATAVVSTTGTDAFKLLTLPLSFANLAELRVGMSVSGARVQPGTRIHSIDLTNRQVMLTLPVSAGTASLAVTFATAINGLVFATAAANGSSVRNLSVGGFTNGAAIMVSDARDVVVEKMTLGQSATGARIANQYGVQIAGSGSGSIIGNTIVASTAAGVRVSGASAGLAIVGNTIGSNVHDNFVGVEMAGGGSDTNPTRLGMNPFASFPSASMTRTGVSTFTIPTSYAARADLHVGLGLRGTGITQTAAQAATGVPRIAAIVTNLASRLTTITVVNGTVAASSQVTFGHYANTTRNSDQLVLPAVIQAKDVYVGQGVSGNGIAAGTTIASLATTGGVVTVTLSKLMTATSSTPTLLTFSNGGRNTIQHNRTGVVIGAGFNTVTNTSVVNNAFDGIRIDGGRYLIGLTQILSSTTAYPVSSTASTVSPTSNVINSNGTAGIRIASSALPSNTSDPNRRIQRNYLGTDVGGSGTRANVAGNVVVVGGSVPAYLVPSATTALDTLGNQHGPTPRIGTPTGPTTPRPKPVPRV